MTFPNQAPRMDHARLGQLLSCFGARGRSPPSTWGLESPPQKILATGLQAVGKGSCGFHLLLHCTDTSKILSSPSLSCAFLDSHVESMRSSGQPQSKTRRPQGRSCSKYLRLWSHPQSRSPASRCRCQMLCESLSLRHRIGDGHRTPTFYCMKLPLEMEGRKDALHLLELESGPHVAIVNDASTTLRTGGELPALRDTAVSGFVPRPVELSEMLAVQACVARLVRCTPWKTKILVNLNRIIIFQLS